MYLRRGLLPVEALEAQGVGPIYLQSHYTDDDDDDDVAYVGPTEADAAMDLPFFRTVAEQSSTFTDAQIRSLAGNGMFVPIIGAVKLFVLSCTVPDTS